MSKRMLSGLIVLAGVLVISAVGFTVASRSQRAFTSATQPTLAVDAPTVATVSPTSENERIRSELFSLELAVERVDFHDTMPSNLKGLPVEPDIAVKFKPQTSSFEGSMTEMVVDYVLRYESQTGVPITSYSTWMSEGHGGTWSPINPHVDAIDISTPTTLNDARATEAVRAMLNLTSDEARKYVNVSVSTLKLSKTQRQIARIEVQDSTEAWEWLIKFGGDVQSPQRVIIKRLSDIANLNSADDIEIILVGLSVAQKDRGQAYQYLKTFYLARLDWQLITNDPLYIPGGPPSGPPTAMPTVLPHMISPLPTPATP